MDRDDGDVGMPAAFAKAGVFPISLAVVVVMAPVMVMVVVPIVVMVVVMMPMVVMVPPVVPMMAVVPVMTMMGPVSRHRRGGQIGILRHGGCVGGRLGGRGRRTHACRDSGEHQQPLEHEISSRDFCGTHPEG
jgi:hypothetical protein